METKKDTFAARIKRFLSGWNLLLFSGFSFIPAGILLISLTWHPTSGPYIIGERYPFGGYLEAWQISTGFAFAAFGAMFIGAILASGRSKSRKLWFTLLIGFILIWFPHFWMGVVFFIDDPSFANFGMWLKYLPFILIWMLIVALGFARSWKETG